MFANVITDDQPICPLCKQPCEGGDSNAVGTPTGLWIMHDACIETWNRLAAATAKDGS